MKTKSGVTFVFFWLPLILIGIIIGLSRCESNNKIETKLPEVRIKYYQDDLSLGGYSNVEFNYYDKGKLLIETKTKARYRGNASFQYNKKSYSLKFNELISLANLNLNVRWKLNAEYIDKTFMRNTLSYNLFRSFSNANYAPEISYCVLYVNDRYQGIYSITESTDEYSLGLNLNDPNAVLFKDAPISYPPNQHKKRFENFQNYSRTSIRYNDLSENERDKLVRECYYNQKFPDISDNNQKEVIHELTEFIFNSSDDEFSNKELFSTYFDIENILNWHLLILITNNGDGFMKNFYIYRKDQNSAFRFTPWDYDHTFGREGDGEPAQETIVDVSNMKLLDRLMQTNAFEYRQNLYAKFLELKQQDILTVEHIHKMIDENVRIIEADIVENEKVWPLDKVKYFKGATFKSEVQLMKDWIEVHLPRIEKYLQVLSNEH